MVKLQTNKFSLFNLRSMAVAASVFPGSSMAMSSATAADDGRQPRSVPGHAHVVRGADGRVHGN